MVDMFRARTSDTTSDPAISELARDAVKGLRRNAWTIVAFAAAFALLSIVFTLSRAPTFEARATLMIDPRMAATSGGAALPGSLFINDELVVDSEIAVLRSERLLRRVARTLPPPETGPDAEDAGSGVSILSRLDPRTWFSGSDEPDPSMDPDAMATSEEERLSNAVDWLRRQVEIQRQGTSYVIGLSFAAPDPELAVQVTNALAQGYIELHTEDQLEQSRRTTEWLAGELRRLSETLARLEAETTLFRSQNNLPLEDENNPVLQEIVEIDAAAIEARTVIRRAQAEMESILLDLARLDDPLTLGRLTSASFEDADLDTLQNQLRNIQQMQNPESAALLLETVVSRLRAELSRLSDTREAQIEVVEATLARLTSEKDALEREMTRINSAQIPLRAKEREIEALRVQYALLSQQLQERETATRFATSNARIIDLALPPVGDLEDSGISLRILLAAILGGSILGVCFVFLREQLDDRVRSSRDMTEGLGLPYIGAIPQLSEVQLSDHETEFDLSALPERERRRAMQLFAGTHHDSRVFADTLRRAAGLLRIQAPAMASRDTSKGARFVVVTSPSRGDGKTMFAANLAAFLAEQGQSVMLVDGDPGDLSLSRLFAPALPEDASGSLTGDGSEALATSGQSSIPRISELGPNLSLVTGPAEDVDGGELAAYTSGLRATLAEHREAVDFVLIDAGALTSAVEDMADMPGTTHVFLIARFGGVSTATLRSVLRQRPVIANKIIGGFVSRVKESRLKLYEPLTD